MFYRDYHLHLQGRSKENCNALCMHTLVWFVINIGFSNETLFSPKLFRVKSIVPLSQQIYIRKLTKVNKGKQS